MADAVERARRVGETANFAAAVVELFASWHPVWVLPLAYRGGPLRARQDHPRCGNRCRAIRTPGPLGL